MRVAVLGSNSFIGSDLVDVLLAGPDRSVLGVSRSPEKGPEFLAYASAPRDRFSFLRADLNEDLPALVAALDAFEPACIVNLSAQGDVEASWSYPADFFRTNCIALAGLVDALKERRYLQSFVQVSSSSVYALSAEVIGEDAALGPGNPYGVSKTAADLLLLAYFRSFAFPVSIVRPPNVYGPHQALFRIVPKTILTLKRGERIDLHGGGYALRQYLHVRDLSRAIVALASGGAAGEIYNVAPRTNVMVREIVAIVCELLGVDFEASTREVEDRRAQNSGQVLGAKKIETALGWQPSVDIRTGVRTVFDWIERDWNALAGLSPVYEHQA